MPILKHREIYEKLRKHALSSYGKKPAVTIIKGDFGLQEVSYKKFYMAVSDISTMLEFEHPTLITVRLHMSVHAVVFFIAILKCNLFHYLDPDINFSYRLLKFLKPPYIVTDNIEDMESISTLFDITIENTLFVLGIKFFLIKLNIKIENNFPSEYIEEKADSAYVITTSGSTGIPKIVFVPWGSILPNVTDLSNLIPFADSNVFFSAAPLTFDPSYLNILVCINLGIHLVISDKNSLVNSKIVQSLSNCKVSIIQMTPSLLLYLNSQTDLSTSLFQSDGHVKTLLFGGEQSPTKQILKNILKNCLSFIKVYSLYGITEVSCWATSKEIVLTDSKETSEDTHLGELLSETALHVVNNGQRIEEGEGQIFIGRRVECAIFEHHCTCKDESACPPCNCSYRRLPSTLRINGFSMVASGDMGSTFNHNINIMGRTNKSVKVFGEKVNLALIENYFKKYAQNCFCLLHRNIIVTFLIGLNTQFFLKEDLKIPLHIKKFPILLHFVSKFPINSHGKIDTKALLCDFVNNLKNNDNTDINAVITMAWKNILFAKPLPDSNFLNCGGNSLKAMLLLNFLQDKYNKSFDNVIDSLLNNTFSYFVEIICRMLGDSIVPTDLDINKPTVAPSHRKTKLKEIDNAEIIMTRFVCLKESRMCLPVEEVSPSSVSLIWSHDMKKCIDGSPLLVKHRGREAYIVVGSHYGLLSCLNASSGHVIWQINLGDRIEASPSCDPFAEKIFVGTYAGDFYGIEMNSGKVCWKFETGGELKCSPIYSDGMVYFGCHDKFFYCLSIDGELLWKTRQSGGSIIGSPHVENEKVFVACLSGYVGAYNKYHGDEIWKISIGAPIFTAINNFSKGIVLGCVNKKFYAVSYAGQILWEFAIDNTTFCSPRVIQLKYNRNLPTSNEQFSEVIVFGDDSGNLYFLSDCGNVLLVLPLEGRIVSTPFIYEIEKDEEKEITLCVVCTTTNGIIYILKFSLKNNNDGKLNLNFVNTSVKLPNCGEIFSSPLLFKNKLYICGRNDHLCCYNVG